MNAIGKAVTLAILMSATAMAGITGALSGDGTQWQYRPTELQYPTNAVVPAFAYAGGCPQTAANDQQTSNCKANLPSGNANSYTILFSNASLSDTSGPVGIWMDPADAASGTQKFIVMAGVSLWLTGSSSDRSYPDHKWFFVGGHPTKRTALFHQATSITVGAYTTYGTNNVIAYNLAALGKREVDEEEMAYTYGFTSTNTKIGTGSGPGTAKREMEDFEEMNIRPRNAMTSAPTGAPNSAPSTTTIYAPQGPGFVTVYSSWTLTSDNTLMTAGSKITLDNVAGGTVNARNTGADTVNAGGANSCQNGAQLYGGNVLIDTQRQCYQNSAGDYTCVMRISCRYDIGCQ